MDDVFFEVTDPKGMVIVCTKDCWHNHILSRHESLTAQIETVKLTITNPTYGVYRDANFSDRRIYYYRNPSYPRYMKVVVREDPDRSEVITAYETDSMKPGEKLL